MMLRIVLASCILTLVTLSIVNRHGARKFAQVYIERESEEEEKELRARYAKERIQYEFDMIKDPVTGKIPTGIFEKEMIVARQLPLRSDPATNRKNARVTALNTYIPAGPNNIGGRTRAVAYDVRYNGATNRVIISGCVSGGIMKSNDGGFTWKLVTPQNDIHSFTTLAQDPRAGFQDIWYAGGGEFSGNSAGIIALENYLGYGIWKSTDNGDTWTKLTLNVTDVNGAVLGAGTLEAFDHPFDITHRIGVNPANGHVYIAGHRRLVRSTDAGASFQVVFTGTVAANSENGQMDVAISNTGRIFLAVNGGNPDLSIRGLWTSTTGNLNSFTRVAGGSTLGTDSVANWRNNNYRLNSASSYDSRRIMVTLAPSNQNIGYVFYENGLDATGTTPQPEADLFRFDIAGSTFTWSNRSANMPDYPQGNLSGVDPLTVQGGYDMMVKVFPTDPNIVFIGGTNLYRSFDGFASTNSIAWINGYQNLSSPSTYPNGHPDIHDLVFNPVRPEEAICANDGGLQSTTNINAGTGSFLLTPVSWFMIPNYQTLQYYFVAMDPDPFRNNFVGGSQDNGVRLREKIQLFTPLFDSNDHRPIISADGASVGISRVNTTTVAQFIYYSYQLGNTRRLAVQTGSSTPIHPNNLTKNPDYSGEPGGEFVTNFKLNQDNTEDLYYANYNRLFRTTSASSVAGGGWTELTGVANAVNPGNPTGGTNVRIRAMAFTRGTYNSSHSIFFGTTNGRVFRLDDPRNAAPTTAPVNLQLPVSAGNVQDIAVNPNNDNEIMAVISNYNTVSIWWTNNAKAANPNWVNAEGNLALPSIRSCMIVVSKDASNNPVTEYYVGTSVGLYSATNIGNGNPTWQREGANILNFAVVQSMTYRPADNVLLIGTHGNGMYFTYTGTPNFNPVTSVPVITNDKNFIKAVYPTLTNKEQVWFEIGTMTGIRSIDITVTNMVGRTVCSKQSVYQNGSVLLANLPTGTYVLTIVSSDRRYRHVQKLVKQ